MAPVPADWLELGPELEPDPEEALRVRSGCQALGLGWALDLDLGLGLGLERRLGLDLGLGLVEGFLAGLESQAPGLHPVGWRLAVVGLLLQPGASSQTLVETPNAWKCSGSPFRIGSPFLVWRQEIGSLERSRSLGRGGGG